MHRLFRAWFGVLMLGIALATPAVADTSLFYNELNLVGGLYDGDLDLMRSHPQTSVGFDYLHKYANDSGDWATLGLQARMIYDTADDKFRLDVMDAFLNFRRDQGRANIRVGRFEIPYGLEPVLDTHGTLLQSNLYHNLGDMWSWGADLNGQLDTVDYRVALMTGDSSEMWPHKEQESWLVTGRVGSPRAEDEPSWGLSAAAGRTVPGDHGEHQGRGSDKPPAMHEEASAVDVLRIGADYTRWGPEQTWMAEASVGADDGEPMGSVWGRWSYTPLENDRWTYALQGEGVWRSPDLNDDFSELSAAVTYRLDGASSVTLLAGHAFDTIAGDPEDRLLLQYYYLGQ